MAAFDFPGTGGVAGDGSFKYTPAGTELSIKRSKFSIKSTTRITETNPISVIDSVDIN